MVDKKNALLSLILSSHKHVPVIKGAQFVQDSSLFFI